MLTKSFFSLPSALGCEFCEAACIAGHDFIQDSQNHHRCSKTGVLVGEGGEAGDLRDSGGGCGDVEMGERGRSGWVKREGQGLLVVVGRKGGASLGLKRNPNWLMGLGKRVRVGFSDK